MRMISVTFFGFGSCISRTLFFTIAIFLKAMRDNGYEAPVENLNIDNT